MVTESRLDAVPTGRGRSRSRAFGVGALGAGLVAGAVILGFSASSGAQPQSRAALLRAHDAAAACNTYYQEGVAASEAASSQPIVVHLTGSYATTPAGMQQWVSSMPDGPGAPPAAIRELAQSTPISVCYLTDSTGSFSAYGSSAGNSGRDLQTDVVAIEPDGTAVTVLVGPLTLPFGPPSS